LEDPAASRTHALVRGTPAGVELVPLGRNPTRVNGRVVREAIALADGDSVGIGAQWFRVLSDSAPAERRALWLLRTPGGAACGVHSSGFTVGGGPDDDVTLLGWPEAAARFHLTRTGLLVELAQPARVGGAEVGADEFTPLASGTAIEVAGSAVTVVQMLLGSEHTTHAQTESALPDSVLLQFLDRGGLLTLGFGDERASVFLPDRRCDLVAALLKPQGAPPGSFVADDALAARVWPGEPGKGRTDINVLLHRVRATLVQAEIDARALLERSPGGGATRFVLGDGATVAVE
jgi:hypothetical protein